MQYYINVICLVNYEVCWPMGSLPTGRVPQQLSTSPFKYLKYTFLYNFLVAPTEGGEKLTIHKSDLLPRESLFKKIGEMHISFAYGCSWTVSSRTYYNVATDKSNHYFCMQIQWKRRIGPRQRCLIFQYPDFEKNHYPPIQSPS